MGSVALEGFGSGGSNPLNFRVIGNPRPETAKENTIWIDTDTEISSWAFASSEHDAMRTGNNLTPYPYSDTSVTKKGITYTVKEDGTITANGTKNNESGGAQFNIRLSMELPAGTYFASSGMESASNYYLLVWDATNSKRIGAGSNLKFTLDSTHKIHLIFQIESGTVTNVVCKPKLCKIDGMVWIATGTSGNVTFNALKKNGIQVYPISAKQIVSGSWVAKTAESYQSGKWVDWWDGELYTPGDEQKQITGGWKSRAWLNKSPGSYGNAVAPTLTKDASGMTIVLPSTSGKCNSGVVEVVNDINVTDYDNIEITYDYTAKSADSTKGETEAHFVAVDRSATYWDTNRKSIVGLYAVNTVNETKTEQVATLDVSNVSGACDIVIGLYHGNAYMTGTVVVRKIKMNKGG